MPTTMLLGLTATPVIRCLRVAAGLCQAECGSQIKKHNLSSSCESE